MNKESFICRICQGSSFEAIFKVGEKTIWQCTDCGFGMLDPYLSLEDAKKLYTKDYFEDKRQEFHLLDAKRKYNQIFKGSSGNKMILDYGCGTGEFLKVCADYDHEVLGYDISSFSKNYIQERYGLKVRNGEFDVNEHREQFNLVTMFDVIEHIPNFDEILDNIFRMIRNEGRLVLTTPDLDCWDRQVFGKKWYGYAKTSEHLNYFSRESIEKLLKSIGFKEVDVSGWGFVRDLNFVQERYFKKQFLPKKLGAINMYFPMHNMLVIAKK